MQGPVCEKWISHRLRKTFATLHHESGVSPRTLQKWLGHKSLETTVRYLGIADARGERMREQVNKSFKSLGVRTIQSSSAYLQPGQLIIEVVSDVGVVSPQSVEGRSRLRHRVPQGRATQLMGSRFARLEDRITPVSFNNVVLDCPPEDMVREQVRVDYPC